MSDSMDDLIIDDNEYLGNNVNIMDLATQTEETLKSFCKILMNLRAEGTFLGKTAESVEDFAVLMVNTLSDMLSNVGSTQKENMSGYITAIDAADDALY